MASLSFEPEECSYLVSDLSVDALTFGAPL